MPAPDLIAIYDVGTAVEENSRNSLLALLFPLVFTRLNAVSDLQKDRQRLELKAAIGAQTGHAFPCPDGRKRFDQWNFQMAIQVVTEPANRPDQNSLHRIFIAQVRACMATIGMATWTDTANWPYHCLAEQLREAGTDETLKADDGVEYSTITFSGVIAVRKDAWPDQ